MLTIAATALAQLAGPKPCPRCFWLQYHGKKLLPFQRFPSVFQDLDQAGKDAVSYWIQEKQQTPPWMANLGTIIRLIPAPHWSKFSFTHGGLTVRGVADLICKLDTGGLLIPDLKTATFTAGQEEWLPVYAAQVGCYALAAEEANLGTVEKLAIIYCQPRAIGGTMVNDGGYDVHFSALSMPVTRNDARIFELCDKASEILSGHIPPPSACDDCTKLAGLISLMKGSTWSPSVPTALTPVA